MLFKVSKKMKKIALIFAIFGLIFSLNMSFLEASWGCEGAFALCLMDYLWMPDYAAVYCVIGYGFCKKYIED